MTAEPGKTYTFDGENKIATAVVGSTTTTYVYDGEGRRVKKTVGTTVTRMVYNAGGELIAEYTGAGSLTKEYIYRGGELIATVEPTNGTEYATADHLGTPRVWTNSAGQVVTGGRHDYLPFGEELFAGIGSRSGALSYPPSAQADGQRNQFTQKERDTETNLDYFLARYYGSSVGRFTSPDETLIDQWTADPQSWNLYSYTRNNPLNSIDPDGRKTCAFDSDGNKIGCFGDKGVEIDPDKETITANGKTYSLNDVRVEDIIIAPKYTPGAAFLGGFFLGLTGPSQSVFDALGVESRNSRLFRDATSDHPVIGFLGELAGSLLLSRVGGGLAGAPASGTTDIRIGAQGLAHVLARHAAGGAQTAGKSLFNGGEAEIVSLIREAGSVARVPQAGGNFQRVVDADRIIGVDRATGAPTSVYTVITDAANQLVTAFPGRP